MREDCFLNNIVDRSKYQVFLFSSPVPLPFIFARHCWFVINDKGKIRSYEFGKFTVLAENDINSNPIGFLIRKSNFTNGMNLFFYFKTKIKFGSTLHWKIETSDKHSREFELLQFIEKNSNNYPFRNKYKLRGPNSNTYPQWVLNHFPELKLKLPSMAIGKNYLKNK